MVAIVVALVTFLFISTVNGLEDNCALTDNGALINNVCCYEAGPCSGPDDCYGLVVQYATTLLNQRISAGCLSFISSCLPYYSSTCYNSRCFGIIGQGCSGASTDGCSGCDAIGKIQPDYIKTERQTSNSGPSAPAPAPEVAPTLDSVPVPKVAPTILTPAPEVAPTPAPTLTPTSPASTPTPISSSALEFSPSPTPNPPASNAVSCIAQDQIIIEENQGKINVSSLEVGNRVMTHKGFQDFIGFIHEGSLQYTLIITVDTKTTIELTKDHLIKVKNTYVHAKHVKVGDHLSSGRVIKVTEGMFFVVSPLTRSGTILVNDVMLSCYANVFSHSIANFMLAPLRVNIVKNVNNYFSTLIAVYNVLPKWFKHIIAEKDCYTF